jgi:NTE family protein
MDEPIRNLVFSGGGVRGVAYVGAIEALEANGVLAGVRRVAGASAGSITAGLLAAGADARAFGTLFRTLDFPSFLHDPGGVIGDPIRLWREHGLHSGAPLVRWLRDAVAELTRSSLGSPQPEITLGELHAAALAGKPVRRFMAVGSNLSLQIPEVFSAHHTPTLPLWQAMRASASYPIVFEPETIDGSVFVDGGLTWNYPIDLFDGDFARRVRGPLLAVDVGERTIGFVLGSKQSVVSDTPPGTPITIDGFGVFAQALLGFALDESTRLHTSASAIARTVFIDVLGISSTDFQISEAQKDQLVANGRSATQSFLAATGS